LGIRSSLTARPARKSRGRGRQRAILVFRPVKVVVIVNPKAGSGAGARAAPEIKRAFERAGAVADLRATEGPGDAGRLARECRGESVDVLAVVGGDGTMNEVAQAYLGEDGEPRPGPPLGLIPFGTGGDFRRTLDLPVKIEDAVTRIVTSEPRPIDLGILEVTTHEGARVTKAFVNIASFGLGGLTDRIVNDGPKWLGGKAAFYLGTVRGLALYRNAPVRVKVDGKVFVEEPIVNVAIANGRYFGGGMMIAPTADPSDGVLEVVSIGNLDRLAVLALTPYVYSGKHLTRPGIAIARGSLIEAEALAPNGDVLVDLDGETPGRLPVRARVARGALSFRA
jgi:diacylglycerol kinase (ATP)